jgi:hypothetical protein
MCLAIPNGIKGILARPSHREGIPDLAVKKSRPCRIKMLTYLFADWIITPSFLAKKDF